MGNRHRTGLRIWAVTDGRAGNVAQALGLAEALARQVPATVEERRLALSPWAAALPARWADGLLRIWPGAADAAVSGGLEGAGPGEAGPGEKGPGETRPGETGPGETGPGETGPGETGPGDTGLSETGLGPPWPDLAVGAGRRVAPLLAWLRRRHGVRAVQLLDPRMDPAAFDLVAAPRHDGLRHPAAVATLGSVGRVTPERIAAAAECWRERLAALPEPRVAVLVGGPSGAARFTEEDGARLVRLVAGLARAGPAASRRPDPGPAETGSTDDTGPTETEPVETGPVGAGAPAAPTVGGGPGCPDGAAGGGFAGARCPRGTGLGAGRAGPAGRGIIVTTSRRTAPGLVAALREALPAGAAHLFDGRGENPYPAMLGLAEAVVVTEDSVNMASEAAASGLPVHVFRLARVSPKIARFHDDLARQGIARDIAAPGDLGSWSYAPLAEADRLAGVVLDRLGLRAERAGPAALARPDGRRI